ncbi:MAG TPA: ABC transporter substrate-binding protein [Chloroflexota bacterium]
MRYRLLSLALVALALAACAPRLAPGATPPVQAPTGTAPTGSAPAAPPAPSAPPGPPKHLAVGEVARGASGWGRYVATEKGFFAAENVDADVTYVGSGTTTVQQVVSGGLDVGTTDWATIILAVENGADLAGVGSSMLKYAFSMMSAPDVRTAADLRGKRAVTSFLKDPNNVFFERWLRTQGVDPAEVDISFDGASGNRYAALTTGVVQAVALSAPFDFRAADEGYNRLVDFGTFAGDYAFVSIYARKPWLRDNGDAMRGFLRAYARGIDWLYDPANRAEAIDILMRSVDLDRALAERSYAYYVSELQPFSRNLAVPDAALQAVLDTLVDTGDLTRPTPPVTKYLDRTYAPR